jgi:hypothetical protein
MDIQLDENFSTIQLQRILKDNHKNPSKILGFIGVSVQFFEK